MRANALPAAVLPAVLLLSIALASCAAPGASHPPAAVKSRPQGEVRMEPLPPLDHAPLLRARAATWLSPGDPILGIQIGDDMRAYPLRILDWHAVSNDHVGRIPVALAWCRPCGSAILYRRDTPKGTLTLAASGRFREGDQLLRDRETGTLWKQLTGEPVEGPLAGSGIRLQPLPVVLTTWGNWTRIRPETRVLSLATGARKDYPQGGWPAADQPETSSIYGLVVGGTAKAYPLDSLSRTGVVNDEIAGRPVVVVWEPGADAQNRTVRAYERGDRTFSRSERAFLGALFLNDQDGRPWLVGEEALTTPDGKRLPRLPGYLTHGSGWYAAYPQTAIWEAK
ncbi:MAG TPA: DUF3179 domain-containing (seleno)protein [Thermoanaerobaculia bacterium]|nr:DUF3179 domain-containing (seleno)protein [Thermoanaerobaculia bacterium]